MLQLNCCVLREQEDYEGKEKSPGPSQIGQHSCTRQACAEAHEVAVAEISLCHC